MPSITVEAKSIPWLKLISRKKKAIITPTTSVTINGLNWSGGSRSVYSAVDLATGQIKTATHTSNPPPWANPYEGQQLEIPRGIAIVSHGTFCGKPATPIIYAHPDDMARLLPAPSAAAAE